MFEITPFSNSKGVFRGSETIPREVANLLCIIECLAPEYINLRISCPFTATIKQHNAPILISLLLLKALILLTF
ncbi:hypothetical protein AYI69_g4249 [Smittium culicis]|uniref:Uncharacterized protein n=1 Tax=Smittium culicis TaxID=133412 RepID=A0A1R1YF63_9FUNG|nr:hypothetical protein AYI69_g4249 [Smittium culicis]